MIKNEEKAQKSPLRNNNPQHKFTRADGVKGGRSRSEARILSDNFRLRKYCNETCKIFDSCWCNSLINRMEECYVPEKHKYLCALKTHDERVIRATKNIYLRGEQGFNDQIREIFIKVLGLVNEYDLKELRKLMYDTLNVKNCLYGERKRTEITGELNLKEQFIQALEESINESEVQEAVEEKSS